MIKILDVTMRNNKVIADLRGKGKDFEVIEVARIIYACDEDTRKITAYAQWRAWDVTCMAIAEPIQEYFVTYQDIHYYKTDGVNDTTEAMLNVFWGR